MELNGTKLCGHQYLGVYLHPVLKYIGLQRPSYPSTLRWLQQLNEP